MKDFFCKNCGGKIDGPVKFCKSCGAKVEEVPSAHENPQPKTTQNASDGIYTEQNGGAIKSNVGPVASDMISTAMFASQTAGTMVFAHGTAGAEGMAEIIAPMKLIIHTISGLFGKIKAAYKEKKRLIPIIAMTLIWLLLMLLPMLGVNSGVFRFLGFLTFAQGGTSGGILGMIGGVVGKGIISYFIFLIIIPIFSGKNPFKGANGALKNFFSQFSIKKSESLIPLLFGVGTALIVYNFLVGRATLQNSIVGIVAFFLSFRAFSSQTGFIRRFVISICHKFVKNKQAGPDKQPKRADLSSVSRFIAGWSTGFAAAVLLSALPFGMLPYLLGSACVIVGIILLFISKKSGNEAIYT